MRRTIDFWESCPWRPWTRKKLMNTNGRNTMWGVFKAYVVFLMVVLSFTWHLEPWVARQIFCDFTRHSMSDEKGKLWFLHRTFPLVNYVRREFNPWTDIWNFHRTCPESSADFTYSVTIARFQISDDCIFKVSIEVQVCNEAASKVDGPHLLIVQLYSNYLWNIFS